MYFLFDAFCEIVLVRLFLSDRSCGLLVELEDRVSLWPRVKAGILYQLSSSVNVYCSASHESCHSFYWPTLGCCYYASRDQQKLFKGKAAKDVGSQLLVTAECGSQLACST